MTRIPAQGEETIVRKRAVTAFIAACLLAIGGSARAQIYPDKVIRILVPSGAGSASDIIGRIFAQRFSQAIGQPVVIENRAGGGGRIGTAFAAKSANDGYTLFLGNSIVLGTLVTTAPNLEYDPASDFAPISPVAGYQIILACNPNVPARSVGELIAYAKQHPGGVRFSTAGLGAGNHFALELMNTMAGVKMQHVPYRSNAQGIQDVIAGQIECTFDSLVGPYVVGGQLRALAVTSTKRDSRLADVPTLDEQGLKGFDLSFWHALLAPVGTPKPVLDRVRGAAIQTLSDPELRQKLFNAGFEARDGTPEELATMIRFEIERFRSIAKAADMKFE